MAVAVSVLCIGVMDLAVWGAVVASCGSAVEVNLAGVTRCTLFLIEKDV